MQNGQEHLSEPLDYLYEELPPERMAEARRHLAECPECRARVREIRDTVKAYRRLDHPRPPAGLAARAAAAAIKEADAGAVGLLRGRNPAVTSFPGHSQPEPALTFREREAKMEEEFNKLKTELQGEMRRGWHTWFFHPGWAVAAVVTFFCSLAMHFSPRFNHVQETALFRPDVEVRDSAREIRERGRLPAVQPIVTADFPLGNASPLQPQEETWLRLSTPSPLPAPRQTELAGGSSAMFDMFESRPDELLLAEASTGPSDADAIRLSMPQPPAPAAQAKRQSALRKPEGLLRPPSASAAPASPPAEKEEGISDVSELSERKTLEPAPETVAAASAPAAEASLPPEPRAENEVVVVDMMAGMEPPHLIARPKAVDVKERINSLNTLATMQMANGEIADAWKTIAMLRHYDPKVADTLSELLREIENASLAEAATGAAATEESAVPAQAADTAYMATENLPACEMPPLPSKYDALGFEPEDAIPTPLPQEAVPVPAPADETAPRPLSFIGEMFEPPEDPPMSLVRVPPTMLPPDRDQSGVFDGVAVQPIPETFGPATEPAVAPASLRPRGNDSRSAALAQTLSQALVPVEKASPSTIFVQPNNERPSFDEPVVVQFAPVPYRPAGEESSPPPVRPPFTTDPYLRDY